MDASSLDFHLFFGALALGVVLLCACLCLLSEWARADTNRLAPDDPFHPKRKLTGIPPDDGAVIELIGSRPDDERPAGVDWTISMWSGDRGHYGKNDRGAARSSPRGRVR